MSAPTEGIKLDSGKSRLDLLPFDALEQVGAVLDYGAKKYTKHGECTCREDSPKYANTAEGAASALSVEMPTSATCAPRTRHLRQPNGLSGHAPTCGVNKIVRTGERNWELGMAWGRLLAAALRHLSAWARGQDTDTESGLPHLAHAACCVLMLLALTRRRVGTDDRAVTP